MYTLVAAMRGDCCSQTIGMCRCKERRSLERDALVTRGRTTLDGTGNVPETLQAVPDPVLIMPLTQMGLTRK